MARAFSLTIVILAVLIAACTSATEERTDAPVPTPTVTTNAPRLYLADWLVSAEAVGAEGPGYDFRYSEIVDDRRGRYLVQSPNHMAIQTTEDVTFCAAIFKREPYCAVRPRAEGAPNVLSYPVQLLQTWGPRQLYDLASHREVALAASTDTVAWERRKSENSFGIATECFQVVGETSAANTGFEICFTDDDLHLVASVDLQGDLIYEIDLRAFRRDVTASDFDTGMEEFFEEKPSLQDQLLRLFPEIPAPRPTPTPTAETP